MDAFIIYILQMKNLRHGEIKQLAQGHAAINGRAGIGTR